MLKDENYDICNGMDRVSFVCLIVTSKVEGIRCGSSDRWSKSGGQWGSFNSIDNSGIRRYMESFSYSPFFVVGKDFLCYFDDFNIESMVIENGMCYSRTEDIWLIKLLCWILLTSLFFRCVCFTELLNLFVYIIISDILVYLCLWFGIWEVCCGNLQNWRTIFKSTICQMRIDFGT